MKNIWKIAFILLLIYLVVKLVLKKNTMDTNNDYLNLPFINKVKDNVSQFGNKVISIANELGWNAKWLMVVMNNESNLNHLAQNPVSTAFGLIQFMKDTLKKLGYTKEQLQKMSNVQQLDVVKKYFLPYKDKVKSVSDAYFAVYFPLALYKNKDYVLPEWAVKQNKIFDINKDGVLTKGEFENYVKNKYSQYV